MPDRSLGAQQGAGSMLTLAFQVKMARMNPGGSNTDSGVGRGVRTSGQGAVRTSFCLFCLVSPSECRPLGPKAGTPPLRSLPGVPLSPRGPSSSQLLTFWQPLSPLCTLDSGPEPSPPVATEPLVTEWVPVLGSWEMCWRRSLHAIWWS